MTDKPIKAEWQERCNRLQQELVEVLTMDQTVSQNKSVGGVIAPPSLGSISDTRKKRVFIGHGNSHTWRLLKDFLVERLSLPYEEFNREPSAGYSTAHRLQQMLDKSAFAFIVLTAEDEQVDGSKRARQNVVHEAGLFQGRLGFNKAILLVERGCEEFSNIHGLTQIRFPPGNIMAVSEEVRRVLERENILVT